MIKIPNRSCKEIVVGGTLNALLYSYLNSAPLVINKALPPYRFESFKSFNALELWNKLFFILSTSGLNLVGDNARAIRIKEDKINVSTLGARTLKTKFEKLIIFDDDSVSGLPLPIKENKDFIVLDWMTNYSCEKHPHNFLNTPDKFVNKVYFYPTERVDGNHPNIKDMVAVSYLDKEQLSDFEYSDTYAKFKVTKMLKDLGIKGAKSGATNYALKIEVKKREIRKAKMNSYKDSSQFKFRYEAPENTIKESYAGKINKLLQETV